MDIIVFYSDEFFYFVYTSIIDQNIVINNIM